MLAKLAVFSLPILWCSQSGDPPDLAIFQIWKLRMKSSIFLVTHWNLSLKTGDLEFLEFQRIWVSLPMNILCIRVFFSFLFIKELLNFSPKMEKHVEFSIKLYILRKHSWMVYQKMTKFFGKKRNHCFVWEEVMFFLGCILLKIHE
jgi:hypothetical protein